MTDHMPTVIDYPSNLEFYIRRTHSHKWIWNQQLQWSWTAIVWSIWPPGQFWKTPFLSCLTMSCFASLRKLNSLRHSMTLINFRKMAIFVVITWKECSPCDSIVRQNEQTKIIEWTTIGIKNYLLWVSRNGMHTKHGMKTAETKPQHSSKMSKIWLCWLHSCYDQLTATEKLITL